MERLIEVCAVLFAGIVVVGGMALFAVLFIAMASLYAAPFALVAILGWWLLGGC